MGKNSNDDNVDYLVGLMFLAFVIIVGIALVGEQIASILSRG